MTTEGERSWNTADAWHANISHLVQIIEYTSGSTLISEQQRAPDCH